MYLTEGAPRRRVSRTKTPKPLALPTARSNSLVSGAGEVAVTFARGQACGFEAGAGGADTHGAQKPQATENTRIPDMLPPWSVRVPTR